MPFHAVQYLQSLNDALRSDFINAPRKTLDSIKGIHSGLQHLWTQRARIGEASSLLDDSMYKQAFDILQKTVCQRPRDLERDLTSGTISDTYTYRQYHAMMQKLVSMCIQIPGTEFTHNTPFSFSLSLTSSLSKQAEEDITYCQTYAT